MGEEVVPFSRDVSLPGTFRINLINSSSLGDPEK